MTDFELVTLYSEQIGLFFTVITVLTTILFSFLTAMYFVAGRMHIILVTILSVLYAVVSFALTGAVFATGRRAASIGEQIVARIEAEGSGIAWMSAGVIPPNMPRAFYYFFVISIFLALVFVIVRRREFRRSKGTP